jgi:GTP-binding protein Era
LAVSEPETVCGFAAIIGAPNAGKSTLINQLTGAKISIVSRKVQTTRARIRAIVVQDHAQVVFVDTPGIFTPKRKLDEAMVHAAWGGAGDADQVLFITDARFGLSEDAEAVIAGIEKAGLKPALLLNKIDLMPREKLLDISAAFNARFDFAATFMISALDGSGVKDLMRWIIQRLPEGPWLYPEDQIADFPLRQMAAEITREQIYDRLHEELPYSSTVETELWEEKPNGSVRIQQIIYVERDGQKAIVLGKGGSQIKELGSLARAEMERLLERKVHLFLFVKVRENWATDPDRLRAMGLDI